MEQQFVNVYFFGKQYSVPASLTIMKAMEYAGYQLIRGCGCRNGFCGACATFYRIKGKQQLHTCLACQQQVEEGMYVATLPFFPLVKQVYDNLKLDEPKNHFTVGIIDDVVSTGNSVHGLEELVAKAGGTIAKKAFVLAEGDAAYRKDIVYLAKIPLL